MLSCLILTPFPQTNHGNVVDAVYFRNCVYVRVFQAQYDKCHQEDQMSLLRTTVSTGERSLLPSVRTTVSTGERSLLPSVRTTVSTGERSLLPRVRTTVSTGERNLLPWVRMTLSPGEKSLLPRVRTTVSTGERNLLPWVRMTLSPGEKSLLPRVRTTVSRGERSLLPMVRTNLSPEERSHLHPLMLSQTKVWNIYWNFSFFLSLSCTVGKHMILNSWIGIVVRRSKECLVCACWLANCNMFIQSSCWH